MNNLEFTKMHGCGNDYVYVDAARFEITEPADLARRISDRHMGIGADGLVMICPSEVADFRMRMFNADGSEGRMCGNASRCIAKYVYDRGLTDKTHLTLETLSGCKELWLHVGEDGKVEQVTVDMGAPVLAVSSQCATTDGSLLEGVVSNEDVSHCGTFVSMGNPHFVCFVNDLSDIDVTAEGSRLECADIFPERCNIEFAQLLSDGTVRMRVWERGSGITLACGTGACATAVAACLTVRTNRSVRILMDGGPLEIEWRESDGHVLMTGPATHVFDGAI